MLWRCWLFVMLHLVCSLTAADKTNDPHMVHVGHLQPFGSSGPFHFVDVMQSFPSCTEFFHHYVQTLHPLKMIGAALLSDAFHKWTDEYFLQTAVNASSSVAVETTKKENRNSPLRRLHFHEFLRVYNSTEQYMVDNIPQEFRLGEQFAYRHCISCCICDLECLSLPFLRSPPAKAKDAICNLVVMSVCLSVCCL